MRILTTSVVVPVLFTVLNFLNLPIADFAERKIVIIPVVIGISLLMLVAWVVSFRLKGERIFTVLVFPSLSIAILVAFFDVIIRTAVNDLDRFSTITGAAFLLGIITYILTSSINILNLSAMQNIPLGQAARAAHYVLTMIFSYFSFVLLVSYEANFIGKIVAVFLLVFAYTFVALWTISLAYSQRFVSTITIATLMTFVFIVLSLWPNNAFYFALYMVLVYYMALGVALEIREIINRWIWYEYTVIFIIILILLFTTGVWGVNGTIF